MSDYADRINAIAFDVARRHRDQVEALLVALPVGATLCVHDEPWGTDWRADSDACTFTIRAKVHVLTAGESCDDPARRTQYGPMTEEIRARVERERTAT